MNKLHGFPLLLIAAFFAASCTMPETRIYSIYLPEGNSAKTIAADVSSKASIVLKVSAQDYLKQPYIVWRKSPYELTISRYSKWDLSPYKIIKREFRKAVSKPRLFKDVRVVGVSIKDHYVLNVHLNRFERLDEGGQSYLLLDFDVIFRSPEGHLLSQNTISKKEAVDDKGFVGLAKGLSQLLEEGIKESTGSLFASFEKRM